MIPFASQRGLGQDLATHLMNAHDNEYQEVAQVRGAVAQDLHGAFAEWEAQAHSLTKCQNYLYSLSVNPDPSQGPLTREQYFDYIDRAEEKLGLTGQPRAVVFHIKHGREHCHVVWSRIDAEKEKAIQLAFDHDKLMMVTRNFAKEHGLELPDGYSRSEGGKTAQLSLYEMHQQRATGLSKEARMEQVTDTWRQSDSAKAFVQALSDRGYILATGNRPYVLVDLYGNMNALPKLINDKTVRTKDIRAFLDKEYPPESLPSVDEAKELVAAHRKEIEGQLKVEQEADKRALLKRTQAIRRQKLETEQLTLKQRQHNARLDLAATQKVERTVLRSAFLAETKRIKLERYRNQPKGLAAFLGRVSGVELLRKQIHKYQDKKRYEAFLEKAERLKEAQSQQRQELQRAQEMQALNLQRKLRALGQIEKRELRSLEESLKRDVRIQARGGRDQVPVLALTLTPRGRRAAPYKAMNRYTSELARAQFREAHSGLKKRKEVNLSDDFSRAADGGRTEGERKGSSDGAKSVSKKKYRYYGGNKWQSHDRDWR